MAWWRPDLPGELLWGGVRQEPGRFALALVAIALGVALGHAIALINRHATEEFARAARDLSGEAHAVVRGPRQGFDEAVYPRLAGLPEVEAASPALELEVKLADSEDTLRLMALDVFRAARVQPALIPLPADEDDAVAVLREGQVFVNAAAQSQWQLRVGGTLAVQSGVTRHVLRVAGTLPAGTGAPLLVMDIAAAQRLFDRIGLINRVDLKLSSAVEPAGALQRIAAQLPAGLVAVTAEQTDASARRVTRAYRVNLAILALVALLTGALMVHAAQSLSVRRRATEHALWRALGVTDTRLRAALLWEAGCAGLAGGVLGVLAGEGIARLVLRWMLAGGASATPAAESTGLAFAPGLMLVMLASGTLAALSGAWLAAARAARVPVAQALRSRDAWHWEPVRRGTGAGIVALAAGGLLCLLPPVDDLPLFGYLAIACLLAGTLALLPRLAQALLQCVPAGAPVGLSLPVAQLRAALPQVSLSLAATVAAVSLCVSMAIMVASFRDSLEHWLDRVLPADLYVRAGMPNDSASLDTATQARVRALPGVARVQFQRSQQITLSAATARVTLLARDMFQGAPADALPLTGAALTPAPPAAEALWVSEIAAALHGLHVGDRVAVPIGGRDVVFVVAGLWRDYARQQGALLIDRARYLALTGDTRANEAALWLTKDADAGAVAASLGALAQARALEVSSTQDLRTISLAIFDRTFAVTYALEGVAIIIGLVGLTSGVGALVLARRREFGVLRHLGFTAGGIRRLLTVEGCLTTGTGIVAGGLLGAAMSAILIHVVNRQSFHWSMDLAVPWIGLVLFAGSLLLLATLASWWSARQALGTDLVRAVKQDW